MWVRPLVLPWCRSASQGRWLANFQQTLPWKMSRRCCKWQTFLALKQSEEIQSVGAISCKTLFKCAHHEVFLIYFHSFKVISLIKNCRLLRDSNSDCQSRRASMVTTWPPRFYFCLDRRGKCANWKLFHKIRTLMMSYLS